MTIAVDFDGTIVEHKYPAIGKERPFAIETLKKLAQGGHKLILWSVREGKLLDEAVAFCHERGLDFYAVNAEYPGASWDSSSQRKIVVDIYLDDRNLGGIPDWPTIYEMITSHLTYADLIERASQDEDVEFNSGTFRKHQSGSSKSHRHKSSSRRRRRWLLGRIIDRCREARSKYSR